MFKPPLDFGAGPEWPELLALSAARGHLIDPSAVFAVVDGFAFYQNVTRQELV